jgi:uncharacterized membrane protein
MNSILIQKKKKKYMNSIILRLSKLLLFFLLFFHPKKVLHTASNKSFDEDGFSVGMMAFFFFNYLCTFSIT